jgi:hypothetical protein
VLHEHELLLEGRAADVAVTYESAVHGADALAAMLATPRALAIELQKAGIVEAQALAIKTQVGLLRDRVQFVLERTTGFANITDPQLWEKAYNDHYEWYARRPQKRHYAISKRNTEAYFTPPITVAHDKLSVYTDPTIPLPRTSCFAAGTMVQTWCGPRKIEEVGVGDRVLAMDVQSGELSYQVVQARTLRPAAPMVKISVGASTISATRGHPFWVNGQGWTLAKQLKVGQVLHSLGGAAVIDIIEHEPPKEAYNLVVGGAGTYFVGENAVLVHDNTPLVETTARVPGLNAQLAAP